MDLESKFREFCMSLKQGKNSLDKHGTLEFDKICLTIFLLHLIAMENEFPTKED
jgi:hypothetical protein